MAFDQPGNIKVCKVFGNNRLWQRENGLNVSDGKRFESDQMSDTEPCGVAEGTMHAGQHRKIA